MPVKTKPEKREQKMEEIKAAEEAEAKKPKPKPKPEGVTLTENFAMPYMDAGVGTVTGIARGKVFGESRLVSYVEPEDELVKLLKAKNESRKVREGK